MLDDYSIYIDPEEDEVFFTALLDKPIITISKPNNSLADLSEETDYEERASKNGINYYEEPKSCSASNSVSFEKLREDIESSLKLEERKSCSANNSVSVGNLSEDDKNSLKLEVTTDNITNIDENKENCVSIVTNDLSTENFSTGKFIHTISKMNISKFNDLSDDKENIVSANRKNIISNHPLKENNQENAPDMVEFKTPLKRSPLKFHNEKSSSKYVSGRKSKRFSKMTDISLVNDGNDFELSADVNESLISWSSVDVNVQLENLMADLEFGEDIDNDAIENEVFYLSSTPMKSKNDKQLEFSWTPGGLNVCLGSQGKPKETPSSYDMVREVPKINIIEASPAVAPPPSPLDGVFNRPVAPIRFRPVYSSAKKVVAPSSSSSSSGSYQSFVTPVQTPLSKTKGNFIPSNIPKPSAKKTAAKSLQFSHIESPISKYIYDKSTPLVSNVKGSKLASHIPGPSSYVSKDASKPQSASKQLPHARYQKGIPLRQEKPTESRLPRLGGNQMRVVAAVPNARVISHNARQTDVSVLVSSPAKINPKHF